MHVATLGEMLSRIVKLSLSRGYFSLLEGRFVEYSELKKVGVRELTTINEIKVNLQELVQSSKIIVHCITATIIPYVFNARLISDHLESTIYPRIYQLINSK